MTITPTGSVLPGPSREPRPASPAQPVAAALTAHLSAAQPAEEQPAPPKPTEADVLLLLGAERFRFVRHQQTHHAVPVDGPPIARPLPAKGGAGGTGSLRQCLIRDYVLLTGRAPSQAALADAIAALDALAMDSECRPIDLRVALDPEDRSVTWLDLGRSDGLLVCIEPGTWSLTIPPAEGPLWRRTRLVGELPVPSTARVAGRRAWACCAKSCRSPTPRLVVFHTTPGAQPARWHPPPHVRQGTTVPVHDRRRELLPGLLD